MIWIRAYTLFHVAGIKSPGAALRSYVISYPGDTTGDVNTRYSTPAWHFTYAEAIKFLNATRATGRVKAREAVEGTVRALAIRFKVNKVQTGPKPTKAAKAKPAPSTGNQHAATVEWLTSILTDTSQPLNVQKKALYTRAALLELEKETSND